MRKAFTALLLIAAASACGGREPALAPSGPSFHSGGNSSDDEELIGSAVLGTSPTTVYTVSMSYGPTIYFDGDQNKHRWGVFSQHSYCPGSEQHYRNSGLTDLSGAEDHCGPNGAYSVSVSGGGMSWSRDIAMLDSRGVPAETGAGGHQDVKVFFDRSSPSTTLSGSLRADVAYHGSTDTSAFGTGDLSVTTGDSVWFISTYQAYEGGTPRYDWQRILNSYNFDYQRSGSWEPAVNSANPNEDNWNLPFNHVFRSPGRTRDYAVRLRVVEPFHTSMASGVLVSDDIVVTVSADSACWTSPGGVRGTAVSFSASCSENGNPGVAEYQWAWGDGASSDWSTSQGATHSYDSAGVKTVTLRIRLSTEEGGMDSTTHTVTIQDPVVLSWTQLVGSARPNVSCSWWVSATGGSGSYEFAWTKNGSPVGQNKNKLGMNTGTSSFLLRVTATDPVTALADTLSRNVTVSSGNPENCTIVN
jgi:hypothetical protein